MKKNGLGFGKVDWTAADGFRFYAANLKMVRNLDAYAWIQLIAKRVGDDTCSRRLIGRAISHNKKNHAVGCFTDLVARDFRNYCH